MDDEEDLRELLKYNLEQEGYDVTCASSGKEVLSYIKNVYFDLILLDVMLPGMDGFDILKSLKAEPATVNVPVIMLTVKGEDADIVSGLELGAIDYVIKPFSVRVLLARVKSILKRQARYNLEEISFEFPGLRINKSKRSVYINKTPISLTHAEFEVLLCLAKRPGWVFSRGQIIDAIKGDGYAITERTIDVHITSLRCKLGKLGHYIETVRGVGYRFKEF